MRDRRLVVAVLAVVAMGLGVVLLAGGDEDRLVTAEFSNARGLVPGNDVRIDGAPVGSVTGMHVTEEGAALVTMRLDEGVEEPRADASAAIRPVDLLGDNYLALDPGEAEDPLEEPIGVARTLDEPRFDDLLRTFGGPERAGLKALLVESGIALDRRGVDLNRAALALRPALRAAGGVIRELGSQNADVRSLVANAERVTSQAADRNRDLGRLVGAFDATLRAMAERTAPLDDALTDLPQTLSQLRETSTQLTGTAQAALPLAESLRRSAASLSLATSRAGPFLRTAGQAARDLHPALAQATEVLTNGDPTFTALSGGLGRLEASGPTINRLLKVLVPAAPAISQGFFVNFPDQAAEPGTQPFDPNADPRRHYWRGAAVLTCQSFGIPIEPGCLQRFLAAPNRGLAHESRRAGTDQARTEQPADVADPGVNRPPDVPDAGPLPLDPNHPLAPAGPAGQAADDAIGGILDFLLRP